jgi:hypothetical protein
MTREEIVVPTVKGFQRNKDNSWDYYVCDDPKIAYLRITQFTPDTYDRVKEVLDGPNGLMVDGMKGMILDLRFNPGGRLDQAIQIVDLFIDKGVIVSTRGRNRPENVVEATAPGTLPYFPMTVLVNEHSASASEIVAGSLMDNKRAVVIGTRTYVKGSVQELIPLDSKGDELKLTVAYYYLPSGRLVHRKKDATDWGVQPQIVVPMDAAAERKAMQERYEQELFRRPMPKSTTMPATTQAGAGPTTQPTDTQLQAAINTMIALVVFEGERGGKTAAGFPATRPTARTAAPGNPAPTTAPSAPPHEIRIIPPATAPAPLPKIEIKPAPATQSAPAKSTTTTAPTTAP